MAHMKQQNIFTRFAGKVGTWTGSLWAFLSALGIVLLWLITGPMFGYSDTWQLVINTGTTIITFLMVFLIQHTQNRDTRAIQLKLDELIRATEGAHDALMDLEEMEESELNAMRDRYLGLAREAHRRLTEGKPDTDTQDISL
jgi:low affinity Fe/Cu permease